MGSLKDEMRGIGEDHKPCEKADDGGRPGSSDGSDVPGESQINTSQESTSQGDYKPGPFMNASHTEETDKNPLSKEQELSGGMCDDTDQSECVGVKDSTQAVTIPLIQKPDACKTTSITHNDKTISSKVLSDVVGENQGYEDKNMDPKRGKEAEIENILVPVPSTPGPSNLWSPAPVGQHHMRTQVSLEVVQCQSAATSPMTPPEDGHSFFFPGAFVRSGTVGADTKEPELMVGKQVGFCSVATSPMTPKTQSYTAFPELIGRETVQREETVKESVGQRKSGQQGSFPVKQSPAEAESKIKGDLKYTTSTELSEDFSSNASPESFVSRPAAELTDSQVTLKNSNQQCKQQKYGSMDQDITIMVTHYNNNEEEESTFYPTETEMVKIDKYEELGGSHSDEERKEGKENICTEIVAPDHAQDTSTTTRSRNQTEGSVSACDKATTDVECENSEVTENRGSCVQMSDVSVMKPPLPESPAPFGCHNIRTQVSLEVVQCQSAATSPMTPPEGDHAFNFPSSFGRCAAVCAETKDAELQVGQQVEFRSVATAPMTPRTPTTTAFPEIKKETSEEQKTVEGKEDLKEQAVEDEDEVVKEEEEVPEQKRKAATEDKEGVVKEEEKVPEEGKVAPTEEDSKEARNCKDKVEEPVQEVSWDEKGMTWEVYGAVVEVTVLGSAIQKHLEKQVKKRQPSMPPPPPLSPSAIPLSSESIQGGSTKGLAGKREQDGEVARRRRNPFRLMMENMQQPHCCSKAHTTE